MTLERFEWLEIRDDIQRTDEALQTIGNADHELARNVGVERVLQFRVVVYGDHDQACGATPRFHLSDGVVECLFCILPVAESCQRIKQLALA